MTTYSNRIIDLAQLSRGRHSPNPMVGAVITHQGKIIGEGFHQKFGQNHAEINAIQSVSDKNLLKESTIYVSLEPCFHEGKTPACVQAILKNKFKKVVVGVKDLNPLTAGQSIALLQKNGVEVQHSELAQKSQNLIQHFAKNIQEKRPYIILKYAVSKDGFIGQKGKQVWLSNPFSKRLVHLWRSKLDAILVGGNTVRIDNPELSARYFEKYNPTRIVLSESGNLPLNAHIFNNNIPTIIGTKSDNLKSINNTDVWKLDNTKDSLKHFMEQLLAQKNIGTILIEGGVKTLQSFIDAGLWDEARIIQTQKKLGHGIPQPNFNNVIFSERYQMGNDEILIRYNS